MSDELERTVRLVGGPFEGQTISDQFAQRGTVTIREFEGDTGHVTREGRYLVLGDEAIYEQVEAGTSFRDVR